MRKSAILAALTIACNFSPAALSATTYTWVGGVNSDMPAARNWGPTFSVTPTDGDTCIFDGSMTTDLTPQVVAGEMNTSSHTPNNFFDALILNITGTPGPFTFTIDDENTFSSTSMTIGNTAPNGGIYSSFTSPADVTTFNIVNGGTLNFNNGSSADANLTGNISYSVTNSNTSSGEFSFLNFTDSNAGKALIDCNLGGSLNFNGASSAQVATITGENSAEIFFDNTSTAATSTITISSSSFVQFGESFGSTATAGSAVIKATANSTIYFEESSSLGSANVTVDSSLLIYNSTNPVSTAIVSLISTTGQGELQLLSNLSLAELSADSGSLIDLGGSKLTVGDANNTTIAGSIIGTGGQFLKQGTGTIAITGTNNTYTGGTTVFSGTLQVSSFTLPPGGNINRLAGTLDFVQNANGTYSGQILTGTGTLQKMGFGQLILTNNSSGFTGTTSVLQGLLTLNGILGGTINISPGASLGGTGTALGNVTSSGIVEPGNNGAGQLNIGGNYVQNASGTFIADLMGSTDTSNRLNVTGTASLAGTLQVNLLDGVINPNEVFTIIHASGGVTGKFSAVTTSPFSLYFPVVTYLPNDVQISAESIFVSVAENYNQMQVANQLATLNFQNATPAEAALLLEMLILFSSPQTVDEALSALSQMSGEQYTNHMFAAEIIGRNFVRRLYDPLREIILNRGGCCQRDVYYNCYESNGCICLDTDPWIPDPSLDMGPWISISGGHTFLRHNHNASGFNANNYEVSMGVQTTLADIWTVGIAGGYEYDLMNYNIGGTGYFNTGMFGIYGLWRPQGYYVLADLVYDYTKGRVKRPIVVGTLSYLARSRPEFGNGVLYVEAGKDFCFSGTMLQPFLGIEVNHCKLQGLTEDNAVPVNLHIQKHNRWNALSRLGLHFAATSIKNWNFAVDLAWQYRMTSTKNRLTENFVSFGNTFNIKGVALPRNSLEGSAYVSTIINDDWELFAEFTGERWSRGATYNFLGGIKITW